MKTDMKADHMTQAEIFEAINANPAILANFNDGVTLSFLRIAFDPERALAVSINLPYTPSDQLESRAVWSGDIKNEATVFERTYSDGKRGLDGVGDPFLDKSFRLLLEKYDSLNSRILEAIKNQTLTNLYPNLTREVMYQYGIVPKRFEDGVEITAMPDAVEDIAQTEIDSTETVATSINSDLDSSLNTEIASTASVIPENVLGGAEVGVVAPSIFTYDASAPAEKTELKHSHGELKAICSDDPTLIRNICGWWISVLNNEVIFHSDESVQMAFDSFNQDRDEPVSPSLLAIYFNEDKTIDVRQLLVADDTATVDDIPEVKKPKKSKGRPKGSKNKKPRGKKPKAKKAE